jgi:hypothetical protein
MSSPRYVLCVQKVSFHHGGANTVRAERRLTPRIRLENVAYIHVEPDSGAIVLDLSDGGIGFYAVAPLYQTGTISFHFSLRAHNRLPVSCDLAWTDKTQKKGGLKFTGLSPEVVSQIRARLTSEVPISGKKG